MKEKDYYKESIIKTINNIENTDNLICLYKISKIAVNASISFIHNIIIKISQEANHGRE